MALEVEREFYESIRPKLLETYRNLFVLIKDKEMIGAFPDAEAAYTEGITRFGLQPFLVKQVLESEPITVAPLFSLQVEGASYNHYYPDSANQINTPASAQNLVWKGPTVPVAVWLGRNVLTKFVLIYNGPGGHMSLSY